MHNKAGSFDSQDTSQHQCATDLEKLPLVGRRPQPADVLEREPADTDGLDGGEVRIVGDMAGFFVDTVDRRQSVDCQTYRRDDDERN